eukprot:s5448_g8.t1
MELDIVTINQELSETTDSESATQVRLHGPTFGFAREQELAIIVRDVLAPTMWQSTPVNAISKLRWLSVKYVIHHYRTLLQ